MKRIIILALAFIMISAVFASCGKKQVSGGDSNADFSKEARSYLKSEEFKKTLIRMISDEFTKCDSVQIEIVGGNEPEEKSSETLVAAYNLSVSAYANGEFKEKFTCVAQLEMNEDTGKMTVRFGESGITIRKAAN